MVEWPSSIQWDIMTDLIILQAIGVAVTPQSSTQNLLHHNFVGSGDRLGGDHGRLGRRWISAVAAHTRIYTHWLEM